jgi:hypothetical protein
MGRQAECTCEHDGVRENVHALLESRELVLRGLSSFKIPLSSMKQVEAVGSQLRFQFKKVTWSLMLGTDLAEKWAAVIVTPPPSLAKKMGITSEMSVELTGNADDQALEEALAQAKAITSRGGDLIVARVNTPQQLSRVLKSKAVPLANRIPVWIVYPKGRGHALNEQDVRSLCLAAGLVDHKVTAVSDTLTALRFIRRRAGRYGSCASAPVKS